MLLNICLLNRFFDFRGTGITRIAVKVSEELVKQGHSVTKIATKGHSLYAYAYHTAIEMPLRLPRKGIDVYHALSPLEAMWLPSRNSIATFLDLFLTANPDKFGSGIGYSQWKLEIGRRYFNLGTKLATRCRFLVCISEDTKQDVMKYINPDERKLSVIRLGISEELKPQSIVHRRFTIGTLSQLDKRKRIDLLIRQFSSSKIDADLLIAGDGQDKELLKELAGDDRRIQFLGFIPDQQLPDFYNRLDLFCFPTWVEGYGLPAVEAMACGKPVMVLTDAIIPNEIYSRCLHVDNYTNVFDNSRDMDVMLKSVNYKGNMQFAQSHRWSDCVSKYIELYKEICND